MKWFWKFHRERNDESITLEPMLMILTILHYVFHIILVSSLLPSTTFVDKFVRSVPHVICSDSKILTWKQEKMKREALATASYRDEYAPPSLHLPYT